MSDTLLGPRRHAYTSSERRIGARLIFRLQKDPLVHAAANMLCRTSVAQSALSTVYS